MVEVKEFMLQNMGLRDGRKQKYYTHILSRNKEEIFMKTITLVSVITNIIVAAIYNHILLLSILYSLCPQQASQPTLVLYLAGQLKPLFLKGLGH